MRKVKCRLECAESYCGTVGNMRNAESCPVGGRMRFHTGCRGGGWAEGDPLNMLVPLIMCNYIFTYTTVICNHHNNCFKVTVTAHSHIGLRLVMAPGVADADIIFLSCGFFYLSFSSPNLSRRRLDVYHTSAQGVALVRI